MSNVKPSADSVQSPSISSGNVVSGIDQATLKLQICEQVKADLKRTWTVLAVCLAPFFALLGWFGYSDFQSRVAETVTDRITSEDSRLTDLSKKALDQILEHSFESERDLARISVDAESVQQELRGLRNELTALKKNRQDVGQELDALATDTQGLRNRLRTEDRIVNPGTSFLVTSDGFAQRLGLTEKRPDFVFSLSADDDQTLWARWDEKLGVYRINPEKLGIPGMAEHAALMSRLFARSYGSTFGSKGQSLVGEDFWMDFRNSIPAFLLDDGGIQFPLYKDMHLSVKDALNRLIHAVPAVIALLPNHNCA